VLPIETPPVQDGAVLLAADGRIAAVGPASFTPLPPGAVEIELKGAALLPGLVNTHTHLELTGFENQLPDVEFPVWIQRLIALKAGRSQADFQAAARRGIRDCWAAGITTVADTGDSGAVIEALAELGASGIGYHEVFGPHPDQAAPAIAAAARRLGELARFTGPRVRLGISPHAPYSVSGRLYAGVAALAGERGLPVAVHLAESAEESLLLEQATGPFAEAWQKRGIPLPALPGRSPVAWLEQHGVLSRDTLCIHVVRADPRDLDTLARTAVAVAHCPRSNRRHAGRPAPLGPMLARGLRVGLGTDSVASVHPLDLLAEAREARAIGGLDAEAALRLATADAARALGLEAEIGGLRPGKWGDLVALDLPGAVDEGLLADTVLSRPPEAVALTLLAGREVYRRGAAHP
jgi:5-methylthioadenosine/S-adenosylhomocysteine deaminase